MEQENLFKQLDLTGREYGYCAGPDSPGATVVPMYICPSDYVPQQTIQYGAYCFGVNSYFANAGTKAWPVTSASLNGVMYYNSSVRIDHISDGTSNTLLAGERYSQDPGMQDTDLADTRGWAWCNGQLRRRPSRRHKPRQSIPWRPRLARTPARITSAAATRGAPTSSCAMHRFAFSPTQKAAWRLSINGNGSPSPMTGNAVTLDE